MVNPVAQSGAGSVPGLTASAELPLPTNHEKEDNSWLETLMKARLLLLLVGIFALESACLAQGSKPGQSAPSPGPTTTAGDPTKYLNRDWENVYNQGRTGDHLRGNVTLAEGALPWDPIAVVVMCDGKAKFTTTTDSQGDFVIARVRPVTSTAIIGTDKSLVGQLVGCSVSAVLAGFDSSQLTIANRDVLARPNIGTITLKRESGAAGTAVSTTTATAPKSAMKSFEKARSEWLDNKLDRAQRDLQKAVEIYPQFAEAWYQLGKIQEKVKSPAAWESFSKAVAADPKFAPPYEQMAPISAQAEKWAEVIDETKRALELNPRGTLDLWYYNALGNYHLKSLDTAETSANKSLAMDPLHVQPDTEQLLAVILVAKNDLPSALQHLRNCLTYFPPGPNCELVKRQIAQIEPAIAGSQNDKGRTGTIENKKQLETLSTLNVPPPSEPANSDLVEKSSSNAKAAPAARNSRWLPPGVDELAPPAESGSGCDLDDVLQKAGKKIQEFVENVERFTATESLYQETLSKSGEVSEKENRQFEYTAAIQEMRPGMLTVDEYLRSGPTHAYSPGGLSTKGLPALLLIFHPYDTQAFSMKCEGLVYRKGQPTWQIYFRQRADKPNTTRSYSFGPSRRSYLVALKGRAWFAADSYQIVSLQTDLIAPMPDIQLTVDRADIEYGPVHFSSKGVDMWVPQTAELYSDLKGKKVYQRMNFGNYLLFSVDDKYKIAAPRSQQ
jgi:tetratricopeptide (TPR) repeat protein